MSLSLPPLRRFPFRQTPINSQYSQTTFYPVRSSPLPSPRPSLTRPMNRYASPPLNPPFDPFLVTNDPPSVLSLCLSTNRSKSKRIGRGEGRDGVVERVERGWVGWVFVEFGEGGGKEGKRGEGTGEGNCLLLRQRRGEMGELSSEVYLKFLFFLTNPSSFESIQPLSHSFLMQRLWFSCDSRRERQWSEQSV